MLRCKKKHFKSDTKGPKGSNISKQLLYRIQLNNGTLHSMRSFLYLLTHSGGYQGRGQGAGTRVNIRCVKFRVNTKSRHFFTEKCPTFYLAFPLAFFWLRS